MKPWRALHCRCGGVRGGVCVGSIAVELVGAAVAAVGEEYNGMRALVTHQKHHSVASDESSAARDEHIFWHIGVRRCIHRGRHGERRDTGSTVNGFDWCGLVNGELVT